MIMEIEVLIPWHHIHGLLNNPPHYLSCCFSFVFLIYSFLIKKKKSAIVALFIHRKSPRKLTMQTETKGTLDAMIEIRPR